MTFTHINFRCQSRRSYAHLRRLILTFKRQTDSTSGNSLDGCSIRTSADSIVRSADKLASNTRLDVTRCLALKTPNLCSRKTVYYTLTTVCKLNHVYFILVLDYCTRSLVNYRKGGNCSALQLEAAGRRASRPGILITRPIMYHHAKFQQNRISYHQSSGFNHFEYTTRPAPEIIGVARGCRRCRCPPGRRQIFSRHFFLEMSKKWG